MTCAPFTLLTSSLVANSWSKILPAFQANIIPTFLSTEKDRKKGMFSLATWPHLVTSYGECATHCRWPGIQIKIRCSLVKDSKRYQGEQSVMSNCHPRLYCFSSFWPLYMLLSPVEAWELKRVKRREIQHLNGEVKFFVLTFTSVFFQQPSPKSGCDVQATRRRAGLRDLFLRVPVKAKCL